MRKGLTSRQMSKLYWEQRKDGKGHRKSFNTTGLAKALSKNKFNSKWKKGKFGKYKNLDFDGDGKINKYDCKPFNVYKQDKYKFATLVTPIAQQDSSLKTIGAIEEDIKNKPISTTEFDKQRKEQIKRIGSKTRETRFNKIKSFGKNLIIKAKIALNKKKIEKKQQNVLYNQRIQEITNRKDNTDYLTIDDWDKKEYQKKKFELHNRRQNLNQEESFLIRSTKINKQLTKQIKSITKKIKKGGELTPKDKRVIRKVDSIRNG